MKIEINIKKTHFILILTFLFLATFVIAYGGNQPTVVGHSIGGIQGVAPNCLANPTHASCSATSGSSWLTTHGGLGNVSISATNAFALEGFRASAFCRGDGTNCAPVPSQYVRKAQSTSFCGPGNAFYCGAQPVDIFTGAPINPVFDFANGVYKAGSTSGANCQWVLCAS